MFFDEDAPRARATAQVRAARDSTAHFGIEGQGDWSQSRSALLQEPCHPATYPARASGACASKPSDSAKLHRDYPRQREFRMTSQKLPRLKPGSLSASTSAFTFPNVVSGLCLIPS